MRDYARFGSTGISWVMASCVYVYLGFRGGMWLDSRWGTDQLFTLLGLLAGLLISLYSLIRELLSIEKAWRKEKVNEGDLANTKESVGKRCRNKK